MRESFDHRTLPDRRNNDQHKANHFWEFFQEGRDRKHKGGMSEKNFFCPRTGVEKLLKHCADFYFRSRDRHSRSVTAARNQNDERRHNEQHRQKSFYGYVHVQKFFYLLQGGNIFSHLVHDIKPLQKCYCDEHERQDES